MLQIVYLCILTFLNTKPTHHSFSHYTSYSYNHISLELRSENYKQVQKSKNQINNEAIRANAERSSAITVLRVSVVTAGNGVEIELAH